MMKSNNYLKCKGGEGNSQYYLNLVPPIIQPHGHCADERLDTSSRLVVGGTEPALNVFIVQHLQDQGIYLLHKIILPMWPTSPF